jgi:hypothetical protein
MALSAARLKTLNVQQCEVVLKANHKKFCLVWNVHSKDLTLKHPLLAEEIRKAFDEAFESYVKFGLEQILERFKQCIPVAAIESAASRGYEAYKQTMADLTQASCLTVRQANEHYKEVYKSVLFPRLYELLKDFNYIVKSYKVSVAYCQEQSKPKP